MAAEDVAQQRAQVAGQLGGQRVDLGVDRQAARSARARARSVWATRSVSAARSSGSAHSAREPSRQAPGRRALGLEQRAQREQHVGQRLAGDRALAGHLEAAQRPGQLAAARRAPGDERAEGAQLVLLVGRRRRSAPRRGAPRAPSANGCHGEPPVRVHASGPKPTLGAVVEAQRREQPAQAHAGVGDRRRVARRPPPSARTTSRCGRARAGRPEGLGGRVLGERVAAARASARRRAASSARGDLEAEQRRDDDGLGAPVVERGLDLGVGALEALGARARSPSTPRRRG